MNQPPLPLFSELTFYVAEETQDATRLRSLLAQNGGRLTEQVDETTFYIIDSFERDQVSSIQQVLVR